MYSPYICLTIYTFDCSEQGQLGFKKVMGLPKSIKFSDIFCGLHSTFDITKDQGLYAWEMNNYGQPGETRETASELEGNKDRKRNPVKRLQIAGVQCHKWYFSHLG